MSVGNPALAAGFARAQADPAGWITEWLDADLYDQSIKLCESVRDYPRTACKAAHSVSKSFTAARIAIWFLHAFPPALVLTTAPTFNQVANILWREIGDAYTKAKKPLLGRLMETQIEISDKWYALGFKAADTNPDRFAGFHAEHILVIKDEASGLHANVHEALDSTLSSGFARELMIGNPIHPSGEFFDAFHSKRSLYNCITIAASDTPNFQGQGVVRPYLITPQWAEEKRIEHGEEGAYYLSRVLAEFPREGVDSLIALSWCEDAKSREVTDSGGVVEIGVDVARFGDDESGYYLRCGPDILAWNFWQGQSTTQTSGKVAAMANTYGSRVATIRVDVVGVGAGVADQLRSEGFPIQDVNVGWAPSAVRVDKDTPEPANLKAEMYWGLRDVLRTGAMNGLVDELTISQLVGVKYGYDTRGRLVIESKEQARRRGVKSPDRAEALLLAFTGPAPEPPKGPVTLPTLIGVAVPRRAQ